MSEKNKTIRELWNASAYELNSFDSLGIDEVENFADEQINNLRTRVAELEAENHRLRCCGNCDAAFCGKNHVLDDDRIQYAPYDDRIIVNSPKIVSHHMADWCIENGYKEWHRK